MFTNVLKNLAELLDNSSKKNLDELNDIFVTFRGAFADTLESHERYITEGQIRYRKGLDHQFFLHQMYLVQSRLDYLNAYKGYLEDSLKTTPELAKDPNWQMNAQELFELSYLKIRVEELKAILTGSNDAKKEERSSPRRNPQKSTSVHKHTERNKHGKKNRSEGGRAKTNY